MMPLVIASRNVHKIRELRSMLKKYPQLDILSILDFPKYKEGEEIGSSFEENASAKALHAAKELQIWSIADDSGLVVPALQGSPGIYSARFAGASSTDLDNRKKLLEEMAHLKGDGRAAYFECAIAIASPKGVEKVVLGTSEGSILQEPRGGKGFGYDSLFMKHEYGKTFAELEEEVKNRISHRRKAFDKLDLFLSTL